MSAMQLRLEDLMIYGNKLYIEYFSKKNPLKNNKTKKLSNEEKQKLFLTHFCDQPARRLLYYLPHNILVTLSNPLL